jgi:putative ABC transport system ATP-binding protein
LLLLFLERRGGVKGVEDVRESKADLITLQVHLVDQILMFTSGRGLATVAGKDQEVSAGDVVVVPAGTQHQFVNKGDTPLEVVTVYAPGEHLPTSVHKTKEEGDKEEEDGIDEAPEWSQKSKKENVEKGLVNESGKY